MSEILHFPHVTSIFAYLFNQRINMKVRVLFAGVLATLLSTAAMAQVDGFSIGPAGAGPNDPITITIYPDQTCPTPASATPAKSLVGATIVRLHGGVTVGTSAWQNVVDAGNGANDAVTGFTQDPVSGVWTKTLTPATYFTGVTGTITGLNFVVNGGPAGAQWDKEGKVQNATQTDCADVSASFPLSGPITEVPTSYLLNTGKLIKGIAPNPAVGATQLKYFLPTAGNVTVKVFNTIGSEVATLQNGPQAAGEQSLTWNADVAPGIYHISIASNGRSDSRKVVVK